MTSLLFALVVALVVNAAPTAALDSACVPANLPRLPRYRVHDAQAAGQQGPWRVTAAALGRAYEGVLADRLLTYELTHPEGAVLVRDGQYPLGDGRMGVRPLPVADAPDGKVRDAAGREVSGSAVVDAALREAGELGPDEPLLAVVAYGHPEYFRGQLADAGRKHLRAEMGQTHLGLYLGAGELLNAPDDYHERTWEVRGYPATLYSVEMEGVPAGVLHQSCHAWARVLNHDVRFPTIRKYKADFVLTGDLASTLEFAAAWVSGDPSVRDDGDPDERWASYCAEHVHQILDTCFNVPFNRTGFVATWGEARGAALWEQALEAWRQAPRTAGDAPPAVAWYKPLWKRDGARDPRKVKGVGASLVIAPSTTVDILVDFVETYAPFVALGGLAPARAIVSFRDVFRWRMGLDRPGWADKVGPLPKTMAPMGGFGDDPFAAFAVPIIGLLQVAEAWTLDLSQSGAVEAFARTRRRALYLAFGGAEALWPAVDAQGVLDGKRGRGLVGDLPENERGPALERARFAARVAHAAIAEVRRRAGALARCAPIDRELAWSWLAREVAPRLQAARALPVSEGHVRWYRPPAAFQRVVTGLQRAHPAVRIRAVATAFDASELELVGK